MVKTAQLTTLKINGDFGSEFESYFVDYLISQTKLEQLALRDIEFYDDSISVEKMKQIRFPLKKLSLDKQTEMFQTEENLLAFLHNFTGTLEMLDIGKSFPDAVYEMIFKNFLKLKSLMVVADHAPKENSFYHNLRPNPSVKRLHFSFHRESSLKSIEGFIGNLPNVERLMLDTELMSNSLMQFISNNLPKLNRFCLNKSSHKLLNRVRMEGLKTLTIFKMYGHTAEDWKALVRAFPNIETFIVGSSDEESLSDRMFNIFTKGWKNLRNLKLGVGFVAIKRVFNQLLHNCKKLECVQVLEGSFKPKSKKNMILRDFKRDGLRFIIHPSDESQRIWIEGTDNLWRNEEVATEFDNENDDDDYDSDSDSDVDNLMMFINALEEVHGMNNFFDSDDSDNKYIYFDSDGEMRNWMEEPDMSDFDGFDGENYHFLD